MLQTLARASDMEEVLADYGLVIVDECHHVPAASFEGVMKNCPAKFVVGLTATPSRKDGLDKLLPFQCGPIRHRMEPSSKHAKTIVVRETQLKIPEAIGAQPAYHLLAKLFAEDADRNRLVGLDAVEAAKSGRVPLIIADRRSQLDLLERLFRETNPGLEVLRLDGSISSRRREVVISNLDSSVSSGKPTVLIATASLIGEGFDFDRLDTLVLASPVSFEGRLVQLAGRVERICDGKSDVLIRDYIDPDSAVSVSMCRKRVNAFAKMGYSIQLPPKWLHFSGQRQNSLF